MYTMSHVVPKTCTYGNRTVCRCSNSPIQHKEVHTTTSTPYHMYPLPHVHLSTCKYCSLYKSGNICIISTYILSMVNVCILLAFPVTCPQGTILHKCDCEPIRQCDGSWFTNMTTCTAYNNYVGRGIKVCIFKLFI